MKQKLFLLAAFMIAITICINGQAKLVEKITKQGNEIVIPYEKYVLPNGLTVKRSANPALRISLST
jgi:zinc protease